MLSKPRKYYQELLRSYIPSQTLQRLLLASDTAADLKFTRKLLEVISMYLMAGPLGKAAGNLPNMKCMVHVCATTVHARLHDVPLFLPF